MDNIKAAKLTTGKHMFQKKNNLLIKEHYGKKRKRRQKTCGRGSS